MTETHLTEEREKWFKKAVEDKFYVFCKNRSDMKERDKGSGGVAILVRKHIGEATKIEKKREDGLMWIKLLHEGRKMYIATVYLLPAGAVRIEHNDSLREQLGRDIAEFRGQGIVLVLGDMNSRIGDLMSIVSGEIAVRRDNIDKEYINTNGRKLIKLMNSVGMVVLTGIRNRSEFTCYKDGAKKRGRSVVDHICVDGGIMNMVVAEEVREDIMRVIKTDHLMVSASLKVMRINKNKCKGGKVKKKIVKNGLQLSRLPNREVWELFMRECESKSELAKAVDEIIQEDSEFRTGGNIESKWRQFTNLMDIMSKWIRDEAKRLGAKQYQHIGRTLEIDRMISEACAQKKEAWNKYKRCKDQKRKEDCWKVFKWRRNRAKKAVRNRIEIRKKAIIEEIEGLKKHNDKVFWRKLRNLNKGKRRKKIWDTDIDGEGVEVAGDQIIIVWKQAYEKLGKKEIEEEIFDEDFRRRTEREVEDIARNNCNQKPVVGLDDDISLSETRKVVEKLANGKAAGEDNIVNEVLKYGGKKMVEVVWHLC